MKKRRGSSARGARAVKNEKGMKPKKIKFSDPWIMCVDDGDLMLSTSLKMDVIDAGAHVVENERVWDYLEAGKRKMLSDNPRRFYGI